MMFNKDHPEFPQMFLRHKECRNCSIFSSSIFDKDPVLVVTGSSDPPSAPRPTPPSEPQSAPSDHLLAPKPAVLHQLPGRRLPVILRRLPGRRLPVILCWLPGRCLPVILCRWSYWQPAVGPVSSGSQPTPLPPASSGSQPTPPSASKRS